MSVLSLLRLALRVIARNKARAFLTVLGIVIGVAAVITMVALGTGASSNVAKRIHSLGANLVIVLPGSSSTGGVKGGSGSSSNFDLDDVESLRREVGSINAIAPTNRQNAQLVSGDANWSTSVFGATPDFYKVREWHASIGTTHSPLDEVAQGKVCVLGQTVATALFGERDPLGQTVRIKKVPFRVIGVLEPKGQSPTGSDQDDAVIIPFSTFMQRLAGGSRDQVGAAYASALSADVADAAVDEMRAVLRQRHHLTDGQEDDFSLRNLRDIAKASEEIADQMTLLLGSIAGVSLLVGGIGIMNIMMVSVTERTREIGIRMAVGARGGDILAQFLVEAVVLSALGGIIGVLLGWVTARILSDTTGWPTEFDPQMAAVAFGFSAAVGVFFGFWPARKAAQLDPIDALRYE
jgi:putative ABC transport system permease protein